MKVIPFLQEEDRRLRRVGNVSHFYKKVCCSVPSQRGNWPLGVVHTPEVISARLEFKVCVWGRETDREKLSNANTVSHSNTQCATHKHPHPHTHTTHKYIHKKTHTYSGFRPFWMALTHWTATHGQLKAPARKDSFVQNVQCAEEFFTLALPTDKPPVSYPLTSPSVSHSPAPLSVCDAFTSSSFSP